MRVDIRLQMYKKYILNEPRGVGYFYQDIMTF